MTATAAAAEGHDLAAPHLPHAHRVARRLLGCDHLADDAVQEALLAFADEPAPPPNVRGWLVRAVVHRARHLRRTLQRRRRHEHHASTHCRHHGDCDNPLHVAIAHELGERLDAALAALPVEQRQALRMYEVTGLDYRGVAERLGLPVGTVRSRLHRARETVRAALRAHLDEAG